jgi:hypothetical protein
MSAQLVSTVQIKQLATVWNITFLEYGNSMLGKDTMEGSLAFMPGPLKSYL